MVLQKLWGGWSLCVKEVLHQHARTDYLINQLHLCHNHKTQIIMTLITSGWSIPILGEIPWSSRSLKKHSGSSSTPSAADTIQFTRARSSLSSRWGSSFRFLFLWSRRTFLGVESRELPLSGDTVELRHETQEHLPDEAARIAVDAQFEVAKRLADETSAVALVCLRPHFLDGAIPREKRCNTQHVSMVRSTL